MAIEIEAKLRVDSHDPVRDALRDCGAQYLDTVLETNRIYDRPDGSLRHRGCALRLRTARVVASPLVGDERPSESFERGADERFCGNSRPGPDERLSTAPPTRGDATTLTVKGPAVAGPLKSREEIEITLDDAESGLRMLELMGFDEVVRFAKRRESWSLDDCRVELDTLPLIGTFVEIEGPDVEAISRVQQRLGLGSLAHFPMSYISLLQSYCEAKGLGGRRIDF